MKNRTATMTALALSILAGLGAGIAGMASAQTSGVAPAAVVDTSAVSPAVTSATIATAPATTVTTKTRPKGHRPMGQDGTITAINGTTITMQEEADEGGAVYTVDASGAAFSKDGATATISSLAVGDKVFVDGTVSGTNVTATSVSLGHPGHMGDRGGTQGQ